MALNYRTLLFGLACLLAACSTPSVVAEPLPTGTPAMPQPAPTATLTATPLPIYTATPVLLPSPTAVPEIRLLFTGDINPSRCVYVYSETANDMALPYRPLAQLLQSADMAVGSLDAAISDINPPTPCIETTVNLLAPSKSAAGLAFAGFDVLTLATNHIKDGGVDRGFVNQAMFDTMHHLQAAGIRTTGAGSNLTEALTPVILEIHGVRFAFLGFAMDNTRLSATADAPGTAPLNKEIYIAAIRQARAQADVVIVLPHWGAEYSPMVSWEQIKQAEEMAAAGARLIVGNHPHRVQGTETLPGGAVVAYALGNFVFDQQWSDGSEFTVQGVLLTATFRGAQLQNTALTPIHIYDNFQPRLAPPAEAEVILKNAADALPRKK